MASILDTVWGTGPQRLRRKPPTPGGRPATGGDAGRRGRLSEIKAFGADPGALRMLTYAPPDLGSGRPLVVVLHGCTQNAQDYDAHAGWSALADELGFALLYPEQRRGNNPLNCFNWFLAADSARGLGEVRSIREMVEFVTARRKIDRGRIFVVGLSAGGAMTANLLAAYPETFAAGAVIAGLPCGAAAGVSQAFEAMSRPAPRSDAELGDAVRAGAPYAGPWPRVSIWQGLADRTVAPGNADQLVRQWLDVHDAPAEPTSDDRVGASRRRVWTLEGRAVVEAITIEGMGHGAPLGGLPGERPGPYMLDVGVSSTRDIAAFFGLFDAKAGMADHVDGRTRGGVRRRREARAGAPEQALAAPDASPARERLEADDPRDGGSSDDARRTRAPTAPAPDQRGRRDPEPSVEPARPGDPPDGRGSAGPFRPAAETALVVEPAPLPAGGGASLNQTLVPAEKLKAYLRRRPAEATVEDVVVRNAADDDARDDGGSRSDGDPAQGRSGVRAAIEKALRAAGLMT